LTEAPHWINKGKLRKTFAKYRIVYIAASTHDPSLFSRKFDLSRQYFGTLCVQRVSRRDAGHLSRKSGRPAKIGTGGNPI